MKINRVTYETTSYHKTPVFRLIASDGPLANFPIRQLTDEELENSNFLCSYEGRKFVSDIRKDAEFGYYVDDVKRKRVIKITDLGELYLIQ